MQHQPVAEIRRLLRRQNRAQLRFDLCRVLALGEPQKVCDADAVRVANDRAGSFVKIAQQQIRSFSANTGKRQERFHRAGNLAAVFFAQQLAGEDDVTCFVLVKPAGTDIVLDLRDICIGKGVEGWEARKKRGRDFVDALVGTLGRQPHGDHQLIVLFVLQRADRVRVGVFQSGNDTADTFLQFHGSSSGKSVFLQYSMFFA